MGAGINPFEVCSGDAFREAFGEVFGGAGGTDAADPFCAGGWRVRRHCEDHHDHQYNWQSDIAVRPGIIDLDDGNGNTDHCERSCGKFGTFRSDGHREFQHSCEVEREWNRWWVCGAGDNFVERKLHGAANAAEPECVEDHGDERG